MRYKLLTPGQKAVNRDRTFQHFAWLTGTYQQFCRVSAHTKENGRYKWQYPQERDSFMAFVIPEISKFCGRYWDESTNPDKLPHPIRVAMYWHEGIKCKDAMKECFPHLLKMLPMIHDRMEKLKIAVNVPPSEWTI